MGQLASSNRVRFEELRFLPFTLINLITFTGVGVRFANPVRILKVTNLTDSDMLISFDGVTTHDIVAAKGFFLYDYSSNKADQPGFLEQAAGERVYAMANTALPTEGGVYVTIVYAAQN